MHGPCTPGSLLGQSRAWIPSPVGSLVLAAGQRINSKRRTAGGRLSSVRPSVLRPSSLAYRRQGRRRHIVPENHIGTRSSNQVNLFLARIFSSSDHASASGTSGSLLRPPAPSACWPERLKQGGGGFSTERRGKSKKNKSDSVLIPLAHRDRVR